MALGYLKAHAHMTTNSAKMMERAQVHNIIPTVNTVAIVSSIDTNKVIIHLIKITVRYISSIL